MAFCPLPLSCTAVMFWPQNCAGGEEITIKIEGDPRERRRPKAKMTPELKYSWGHFSCSCLWTRISLILCCISSSVFFRLDTLYCGGTGKDFRFSLGTVGQSMISTFHSLEGLALW